MQSHFEVIIHTQGDRSDRRILSETLLDPTSVKLSPDSPFSLPIRNTTWIMSLPA